MMDERWRTDGWMKGGWVEKINKRVIDGIG